MTIEAVTIGISAEQELARQLDEAHAMIEHLEERVALQRLALRNYSEMCRTYVAIIAGYREALGLTGPADAQVFLNAEQLQRGH